MLYYKLANLYAELEKTSKTLEKTALIAEFLKKTPRKDLKYVILLLLGSVSPDYETFELGIGKKLVVKAVAQASGNSESRVTRAWRDIGDIGRVAEKFCKNRKQSTLFSAELSVKDVFENLRKLPSITGSGSIDKKLGLLKKLLVSANPQAAKYIIRTVLGELRTGVGKGIIRDAIARAFNEDAKDVESAYNLTTDFASVAELASSGKLKSSSIEVGRPIRVMLYPKEKNIEAGFKRLGKPAACEYKYDGFRGELHKDGKNVKIFTRRLEDVSKQFPDVVEWVKNQVTAKTCILDSEIIGIDPKTRKWLPFQAISQRIKRKYNIPELVKTVPVQVNVFDVLYLNGKSLISSPFSKRRKAIERIVKPLKNKFVLAVQIVTDSVAKATKFYKKSLSIGNEGIMMKSLSAPYTPGARVGSGVKIKPIMEPLDLTIVGAEWGTGKRSGWLSSFTLACRNGKEFLPIGKMGTGIKEKAEEGFSFGELTKELKKDIVSSSGREVTVKPRLVVEVAYEEIQRSPTYSSGYALRFPRMLHVRWDRDIKDIDNLERIKKLYIQQRGRV